MTMLFCFFFYVICYVFALVLLIMIKLTSEILESRIIYVGYSKKHRDIQSDTFVHPPSALTDFKK